MISEFVDELGSRLSGPRRVKSRLLEEAEAGLVDAAEDYRAAGLHPDDAARRALVEFGAIAEIRPQFQTELDDARRRRAATAILVTLASMGAWWTLAWQVNPHAAVPLSTVMYVLPTTLAAVGAIATLVSYLALQSARRDVWQTTSPRQRSLGRAAIRVGMVAFVLCGAAFATTAPAHVSWHPIVSTGIFAVLMFHPLRTEFRAEMR